jgi:hypothetical protein
LYAQNILSLHTCAVIVERAAGLKASATLNLIFPQMVPAEQISSPLPRSLSKNEYSRALGTV